jgi:tRNA1(Val) A37 N6-methylase TrmN6
MEQDIIGSCPPYFKLEQYSEDDSQCYNKYNEYELWLEKYWKETVIKSCKKLKRGGVFFVVINNNLKEDVVKTIVNNTKLKVHSEFVIKSSKSHLYNKKESEVKNKYNETVIFFK